MVEDVQGDGVHHVFDDDSEHSVGAALRVRLAGQGLRRLQCRLRGRILQHTTHTIVITYNTLATSLQRLFINHLNQ